MSEALETSSPMSLSTENSIEVPSTSKSSSSQAVAEASPAKKIKKKNSTVTMDPELIAILNKTNQTAEEILALEKEKFKMIERHLQHADEMQERMFEFMVNRK